MSEVKKKVLKISGSSPTPATAGSIVKAYEEGFHDIELRSIGASSVNQMFKAMATASGIFAQKGKILTFRPGYDVVNIDGCEKTAMIAVVIVQ